MYINITVSASLNLFGSHKEFLIQFFIKLVKNQTSLCGNKGTVCIGIFLISHIHNGLTLFVYIIHHADKVLFIITVIPITFGNDRFYLFQCTFYNVVHDRNRNFFLLKLIYLIYHILANMIFFFIGKLS